LVTPPIQPFFFVAQITEEKGRERGDNNRDNNQFSKERIFVYKEIVSLK
jgi:hypothetical protein